MERAIEMEHMQGEVVVVRTLAKDSSIFIVSGDSAGGIPPLYLKNGRDYELAMVNLERYYSFANIRADNNSLQWIGDGGKMWTLLHIYIFIFPLRAPLNVSIAVRGVEVYRELRNKFYTY